MILSIFCDLFDFRVLGVIFYFVEVFYGDLTSFYKDNLQSLSSIFCDLFFDNTLFRPSTFSCTWRIFFTFLKFFYGDLTSFYKDNLHRERLPILF